MKRLAVGILAHVDAGKPPCRRGPLYRSGALEKNWAGWIIKNAFLDTMMPLEQGAGDHHLSKQAVLAAANGGDHPAGHLGMWIFHRDGAHPPGIGLCYFGHQRFRRGTGTHPDLWDLLVRYQVPTFCLSIKWTWRGLDRGGPSSQLKRRLGEGCVDFGLEGDALWEAVALCDEGMPSPNIWKRARWGKEAIRSLARAAQAVPLLLGSCPQAGGGVDEFLAGLGGNTPSPRPPPTEFGARVYKISRDAQGNRLTHMKVTRGA